MANTRLKLITFSFLFILASCGPREKQFDRSTWNLKDDIMYTNRESMVADLIENHLRAGMSYNQLIELIGPPESYSDMKPYTLEYEIMVDYGWNIDPVKGKTLVIELTNDSLVKDINLKEWNH